MSPAEQERISDRNVRDTIKALTQAENLEARVKIMEAFSLGVAMSSQERLRDLYRRLPRRPWMFNLVSSLTLFSVVGFGVWIGTLQAEVSTACDIAKDAAVRVDRVDDRLRAVEAGIVRLVTRQESEALRQNQPPLTSRALRQTAEQLRLPTPKPGTGALDTLGH